MPDEIRLGERLSFGSPGPGDPELLSRLLGTSAFKKLIWAWQFGRSPDRATPVTAYIGGELVGFNGLMAVEVHVDGRYIPAAWSCDFIVSPEHRRHGVGRAIKQELDRRCSFLMTLGTSEAAAKVLGASGWQQGEGPRTYTRIHRARSNRERARKLIQWVSSIAPPRRQSLAGFDIKLTDDLPGDNELDRLWASVSAGYVRCVVRDAHYLRWRYAGHPLGRYRFVQSRQNGELVALAVVSISPERALLVDYLGPIAAVDAKRGLVSAYLEMASGSRVAECTTSDRELRAVLREAGFLPTGSSPLRFFVRATSANPPPEPARGWFLMGGDSDGEILSAAREASWTVREFDEAEFAAGRDAWEALLVESDADRLFMSWDWQHCWWRHFSRRHGLGLRLVAVYDVQGALAGLAPFFIHEIRGPAGVRLRRLEPIGNLWGGAPTMRSEYLGPVLRRGTEREAAQELWTYLLGQPDWDDLAVQDWRGDQPASDQLNAVMGRRCRIIDHSRPRVDEAHFVPLAAGFDAYLAGLSGNARRSMFNRRRYLESLGEVTVDYAGTAEVGEYFRELNRLHALRWGEPVFSGHRLEFHEDLATCLAKQDRLRFSRLSVDGRVVSVLYHLRGGGREYNLQMGFDDDFHATKISLGLLHLGYAIEHACEEGMEAVDLLAGAGKQGLFKHRVAPGKSPFVRRQYLRSPKAKALFGTKHELRSLLRGVLRIDD
jgi:GNAT superfamily N-acetyltransferase